MKRFILSLSDLKSASMTMSVITQSLPVDASVAVKCELLLVMASFYYRAAQFAAKCTIPGTCKFALNMAILYAEFAGILSNQLINKSKLRRIQVFLLNLSDVSRRYLDKKDGYVLFG